jgi:hypothetical protein
MNKVMKANAPEKIYLQVCGDCQDNECDICRFEDLEDNVTWCKDKIFDKDVEYIRADALKQEWKPSEGQLECLGYAIEKAEKDWSPLTNNRIYLTLKALKEQLLELKGSKV